VATTKDGVVSSQTALDEGRDNPPVARGSRMVEPTPTAVERGWVQSLAPIAVFDIAAPLVTYSLLRSSGSSTATALVISGVFPAFGVALAAARNRRLDVIGAVVLVGIAVGSVIGLATGDARLLLLKGSVPTAVFGVLCLASLWSSRPLIFRFALEFKGADTPKGREFAALWRYAGFRHPFRVITAVWGVAYLAEAAARIVIVETTSTGTALGISKAMPFTITALLVGWMALYGRRAKRRGERTAQVARDALARGRGSRDSITSGSEEPAANRDPPPRRQLASPELVAAIRPPASQPAGTPGGTRAGSRPNPAA
jgi:hypothetical protein